MKRIISLLLVLSLIVAIALSGCSKSSESSADPTSKQAGTTNTDSQSSPEKKITLRVAWWGNQVRNERTQKVMDMYSQKNPNIAFEAEMVAWDGYWDKLATQSAANNLPDVIQQDYSYIGQYISKNLLEDMNPFVDSGIIDTKDISPDVIASGSMDGGFYAMSLGTNALTFLYDPEAFKSAGIPEPTHEWTWEEYEDIITQVYEKTGLQAEPVYFTGLANYLVVKSRQEGFSFFSKDGTSLGFTDPNILIDIFETQLRLTKAGVYTKPDVLVSVKAVEDNPISKGTAFTTTCWSNQVVAFSSAANKPLTMIMPPRGGVRSALYLKPSQFFSITASSELKEESAKFINYFTNDVDANKVLLGERGVPVSAKVRDGIKDSLDENNQKIFEYISEVEDYLSPIDPPDPPGSAEINKALTTAYEKVIFEKATPEDAANSFMKEANEILAKNKKQ